MQTLELITITHEKQYILTVNTIILHTCVFKLNIMYCFPFLEEPA